MNLSKRYTEQVTSGVKAVVGASTLFYVLFLYMDSSGISYDLEGQLRPKDFSNGRDMKPKTSTLHSLQETDQQHSLQRRHIFNTLPNFFLHKDRQEDFKDAVINFWRMQKTGGSSMETCLMTMYKELNYPSPFFSMASCKGLSKILNDDTCVTNMTYRPVIHGHYFLGVCDFLRREITDRKCSVFTIFRDPYERAVSHYFFHRQNAYRQPEARDITELPINEWVKKFGSITWSNLILFRNWKVTTEENGRKKCTDINNGIVKTLWPQNQLTMNEILNNLDKHLSFIGLFDDKPTTYKMLQEIYHLPFYDECLNIHQKVGYYEGLNATSQIELKRETKETLMKDKELVELMKFDVKLYKKAKEIFYAQKREFEKRSGDR